MSDNVIQPSFASGELSPSLFARVDISKYHSGAARMRNFFVDYRSGASTRAGTEFIRPGLQGAGPIRLVRFEQSVDVTYCLEFGHFYLRFMTQGGSVVEPGFAISSITPGTATIVTAPGNGFGPGDLVFIDGVIGIPQINSQYYLVQPLNVDTFIIVDGFIGGSINSTTWPVFAGGGAVSRVYTISTPYSSDELALLKFSQKASQLNITHPTNPPYTLTLISATDWTLLPTIIGSTSPPPGAPTVIPSAVGPAFTLYCVTAIDANGQESQASPNGGNTGMVDLRTTSGTIQISWVNTGAFAYNIYKTSPSLIGPLTGQEQFGFIGTTTGTFFIDSNIDPDFTSSPPIANNPFDITVGADPFPQVSGYFQQRLVYANGGGNDLDRFWMSKPGAYNNFDVSNPSEPDDSLDARLVSLEVNAIKSMVPMPSGLVMLTTKGAWQISGGAGGVATQGGPVTPTTLTATSQAYIGASDVPPILVNYDIFFVQQKGSIIRDLAYNIYANIYTGNDVSILSNHLFYGHQVLEWAYAEEPFKVIWAVREDGVLLSLTVVKEQEMYGWARHDTQGYFRSVATITEGMADATYVVVDRPILGTSQTVKCIERIAERSFPFGVEDAWCVDFGVKTDSNEPSGTVEVTFESPNAPGGIIQAHSTDNNFSPEMIGWVLRIDGGIVTIIDFIDEQTVIGQIVRPLTNMLTDDPLGRAALAASGTWALDRPFTQVFGLGHLEGRQVSVLADGSVINGLTVSGGTLTLPSPATKVIVGLGFQAQLQTMYLDLGQETNTVQGKRKKIGALTVRVKDSRGVKAGRTFDSLVAIKEMNRVTLMGTPMSLVSADERIIMDPLWDVPGQICLQVDDPVPATVLGVVPEVVIGDTSK